MTLKFQLKEQHWHYTDWKVELTPEDLVKLDEEFNGSYMSADPNEVLDYIMEELYPDLEPYNDVFSGRDWEWNNNQSRKDLDNLREFIAHKL